MASKSLILKNEVERIELPVFFQSYESLLQEACQTRSGVREQEALHRVALSILLDRMKSLDVEVSYTEGTTASRWRE
jgi:hypothetical protein